MECPSCQAESENVCEQCGNCHECCTCNSKCLQCGSEAADLCPQCNKCRSCCSCEKTCPQCSNQVAAENFSMQEGRCLDCVNQTEEEEQV
jgi:hypothetical protein